MLRNGLRGTFIMRVDVICIPSGAARDGGINTDDLEEQVVAEVKNVLVMSRQVRKEGADARKSMI